MTATLWIGAPTPTRWPKALGIAAEQRRVELAHCDCSKCPRIVGAKDHERVCNELHHESRGRFHRRLYVHGEPQSRRERRDPLGEKFRLDRENRLAAERTSE